VPKLQEKSGALVYPEPLEPPRPVAGDLHFTCLALIIRRNYFHYIERFLWRGILLS